MANPIKGTPVNFDDSEQAVTIIPEALNEEFARLPSDLAYWNAVYADNLERLLKAKRDLELGEAEIRLEYKAAAKEKVTESYLDACVVRDPRYRSLREQADQCEVLKARTNGVVDAIRAKKEMLISLGAHIRAEMQPPPSINR